MLYRYDVVTMQRQADVARLSGELEQSPPHGLFTGALGFASTEAAILSNAERPDPLAGVAGIAARATDTLTPVARGEGALKKGGIYVHRWFVIDHGSEEKFIALSTSAWPAFERDYDTTIFGLFAAARSPAEIEAGAARILLLTHYASHDVWEKSRNPTQEAFENFRQRHAITRTTVARSSYLVLGSA